MSLRLAVCVAGEHRSAACPTRDSLISPLESQADFLAALQIPHEAYIVLDALPRAADIPLADDALGASLRASARRMQRTIARMQPVEIVHEDAREAEADYWQNIRPRVCIKLSAAMQARKLQTCWRLIMIREEKVLRRPYDHVMRLRPDLLVPLSAARIVAAHIHGHTGVRSIRPQAPPWRAPSYGWGDHVCVLRPRHGRACQISCAHDGMALVGASAANRSTIFGPTTLPSADVLTLPPFTPALRNDTYVNDVFWVSTRHYAPALFGHLEWLTSWAHHQASTPPGQYGAQPQPGSDLATSCGAVPRLAASPACHRAASAPTDCATGGHECMLSHALSARQQEPPQTPPPQDRSLRISAPLRVAYLALAKAAPQVTRLADSDPAECAGMKAAYLCSEKRKVRPKPDSSDAAAASPSDTDRERLRRCKQADRTRHAVHVRTTRRPEPV